MSFQNKKIYTNEQEEKIAKTLTRISVSARICQHIMWEVQYMLNDLSSEGIDISKVERIKDQIFNKANELSDSLLNKYDESIYWKDRPKISDLKHPITYTYDNADGLLDVDIVIRNEAEKIYDECKLVFESGEYYESGKVSNEEI